MTIERIQPEGLTDTRPLGFSQVVATEGGKHVFVSGQVAIDARGGVVGRGDLSAQTHQVMRNLATALEAAGATFADVVKLTVLVVDYTPAMRPAIVAARNEYLDPAHAPASTLIGVQALAAEDYLIEIEATAVVY